MAPKSSFAPTGSMASEPSIRNSEKAGGSEIPDSEGRNSDSASNGRTYPIPETSKNGLKYPSEISNARAAVSERRKKRSETRSFPIRFNVESGESGRNLENSASKSAMSDLASRTAPSKAGFPTERTLIVKTEPSAANAYRKRNGADDSGFTAISGKRGIR